MLSVISELIGSLVEIEVSSSKAWSKGGSSQVRQEAPKRLEAEGWDSVRPALSVTVR